jgi:hypothetical protein
MATVHAAIQALQLMKKRPHASVNPVTSMSPLVLLFAVFGFSSRSPHTYGRLGVVDGCDGLNAITPDVRPELSKREPGVMSDNALAQLRSGFSRSARAEVQVIDLGADGIRELFALGRLRRLEVRSEIHVATNKSKCVANIDQNDIHIKWFDVLKQIFLHVDQND